MGKTAMFGKHLLLAILVIALLSFGGTSQAHMYRRNYGTPDIYVVVPSISWGSKWLDCDEARSYLEDMGYHISKTLGCGGNYHHFRGERRGFRYTIYVMTERGQEMVDKRGH